MAKINSFFKSCFSDFDKQVSFCKKKSTRISSNCLGSVPIIGSIIGPIRMIFHAVLLISNKTEQEEKKPLDRARFRLIKVVQGAAEFIPIIGPCVFWVARFSYLQLRKEKKTDTNGSEKNDVNGLANPSKAAVSPISKEQEKVPNASKELEAVANASKELEAVANVSIEELEEKILSLSLPQKDLASWERCKPILQTDARVASTLRLQVSKILDSANYSEEEKRLVFAIVLEDYLNASGDDRVKTAYPVVDKTILSANITHSFIKFLGIKHQDFHLLKDQTSEILPEGVLHDDQIQSDFQTYMQALPVDRNGLFGNCVRIGVNHRAAFVIDLNNRTVEFFNSWGNDKTVKNQLEWVAKQLSQKYGVGFRYIHKTEGMNCQNNGYECGIWACKFIEERIKQGPDFDPNTLYVAEKDGESSLLDYRQYVIGKSIQRQLGLQVSDN